MQNITIFVQEYDDNEILKGIYIKEKLKNNEDKIIIANKGELIKIIMDLYLNLQMVQLQT